jgi:hypothetical protein
MSKSDAPIPAPPPAEIAYVYDVTVTGSGVKVDLPVSEETMAKIVMLVLSDERPEPVNHFRSDGPPTPLFEGSVGFSNPFTRSVYREERGTPS